MKVLEGTVAETRAQVAGAVAAARARGGVAAVRVGRAAGVEQAWPAEEATVSITATCLSFIQENAEHRTEVDFQITVAAAELCFSTAKHSSPWRECMIIAVDSVRAQYPRQTASARLCWDCPCAGAQRCRCKHGCSGGQTGGS